VNYSNDFKFVVGWWTAFVMFPQVRAGARALLKKCIAFTKPWKLYMAHQVYLFRLRRNTKKLLRRKPG